MKTPMDHDNKNAAYPNYGHPLPCLDCDGTGVTFVHSESGAGGYTIMCSICNGTGTVLNPAPFRGGEKEVLLGT